MLREYAVPIGFKLTESTLGGIVIRDSNDRPIGLIERPWAVDANGQLVETRYILQDGTITQTINHANAAYPVVADPWWNVGYQMARVFMSAGEKEWCDSSSDREDLCIPAYGNHALRSIGATVAEWGYWGGDGEADAFQHCLWAARMTIGMSRDDAETIGDLYEDEDPNQTPARERMDQWNNSTGRGLGVRLGEGSSSLHNFLLAANTCVGWALDENGPLQRSLTDY